MDMIEKIKACKSAEELKALIASRRSLNDDEVVSVAGGADLSREEFYDLAMALQETFHDTDMTLKLMIDVLGLSHDVYNEIKGASHSEEHEYLVRLEFMVYGTPPGRSNYL